MNKAVLLENDLVWESLRQHLAEIKEIENVPYLPEDIRLFYAKLKERNMPIYCVKGMHYINEGIPLSEIVFPVHVSILSTS